VTKTVIHPLKELFPLTIAERQHDPRVQSLRRALEAELQALRIANDASEGIAETTLRRGEIRLAKRILAHLEVGPESRPSDADGAELAFDDFGHHPSGD
jgi:hypothetical protein